jgi:hypothetical protein
MGRHIGILVAALMLLFLTQATNSPVQAQEETYTVSGQIVWKLGKISLKRGDESMAGQPVVGAKVRIGPGNYTATTDATGRFTITGVPRGSYAMHIKAREHSSMTRMIVVNENEQLSLELLWRNYWLGKGKRNVQG